MEQFQKNIVKIVITVIFLAASIFFYKLDAKLYTAISYAIAVIVLINVDTNNYDNNEYTS